jgi:hypothetical protein
MKYIHTEEGLVIKYSWKERILIMLRGTTKFDKKSSYQYYGGLMHLISTGVIKYGDSKIHGDVGLSDKIKTN